MKLLLLLVLSSAGLQDIMETSSRHQNVLLNPDLVETAPEITAERSTLTHRQKRQAEPSSPVYDNGKLKWQIWSGSLPNGAVSINNNYAKRADYVCKYSCFSGFYNPDMGSYCNYPYGDKEYQESSFDILVNEDNFETLEWKDGSHGSVPPNSVRTCSDYDIYVGKNRYGLGKVHVKHEAFFLPWEGSEYWYKNYEVLTINLDVQSEHISNVKYNTSGTASFHFPPETICVSNLTNYECNPVLKTASLSKRVKVEKRWDFSGPIVFGINRSFTGRVPSIVSGSIGMGAEVTLMFSGGHAEDCTEEITHSMSVELTVPPNYSCKALMVGYKDMVNVSFTADLRRTYRNGGTSWTSISGTYEGGQVGEVHSEVGRCKPVPDATSCSEMTL